MRNLTLAVKLQVMGISSLVAEGTTVAAVAVAVFAPQHKWVILALLIWKGLNAIVKAATVQWVSVE